LDGCRGSGYLAKLAIADDLDGCEIRAVNLQPKQALWRRLALGRNRRKWIQFAQLLDFNLDL